MAAAGRDPSGPAPPVGGDTLFANMYVAYDALSDGMKKLLDGLHGIHLSGTRKIANDNTGVTRAVEQKRLNPPVAQPVLRVHPETGRKALYVNVAHTARFRGMTGDESGPLLRFLFEHQVKPEFTCRFQWRVGSLAFWDNRCVQHNPVNDYHGYRRVMHRITLAGDRPR